MYEPLGYGDFPDIQAIAKALSLALDQVAELTIKVHELSAQIDGMTLQAPQQTGGYLPRNWRDKT
jgi:hypothetical protein